MKPIDTPVLGYADIVASIRALPTPDPTEDPFAVAYLNVIVLYAQAVRTLGALASSDAVQADKPALAKVMRVSYTKCYGAFEDIAKALGIDGEPEIVGLLPKNLRDIPDVDALDEEPSADEETEDENDDAQDEELADVGSEDVE